MSYLIESQPDCMPGTWVQFTVEPFQTREMANAHLEAFIVPYCKEYGIDPSRFRVRDLTDPEERLHLIKSNQAAMDQYLLTKTPEELLAIVRDYSDG